MKNPQKDLLEIKVGADEDITSAIRRFTKKVRNSGLFQELYGRRHFEKPSVKKKRKHALALQRSTVEDDED